MKIVPRKPTDRGGILSMPLVENVPRPTDTTWKKTTCPKCGKECWDRPLPEEYQESMFNGKLCTLCALQMGVSRGGGGLRQRKEEKYLFGERVYKPQVK